MDKDTTEPTPSGNIRITKLDDGNIRLDVIDLITAQTREIDIELWSIATNILDDDRDRMWLMVDEVYGLTPGASIGMPRARHIRNASSATASGAPNG